MFCVFLSHPPLFSRFAWEISGLERLGPWIFCVFAGCFCFFHGISQVKLYEERSRSMNLFQDLIAGYAFIFGLT